jgi:TonB family protein
LVILEPANAAEQVSPVVFPSANERECLRARVADVDRDVPAVLRDPPESDARRVTVGALPEVDDEGSRQAELEERSTEEPQKLAEGREDEMTGLVDRQIDRVEKASGLRPKEARHPVQGERAAEQEAQAAVVFGCGSRLGQGVHYTEESTDRRPKIARVTHARRGSVYRQTVSRFPVAALCATAALASLVSSGRLVAQERDSTISMGAIAGVVRDSSGALLFGADVSVAGTALRTISDTGGRFRLAGVPSGAGALQVRRLGYRAASLPITIERGATASVTVTLARLPRELDPIVVEASRQPSVRYLKGFYERRSKGHGYFLTRDQISTRHWSDMTDVLRSLVPAVRITSSRMARNAVRLRGNRCAPLVWLDGAPAMAGEFDLDVIRPETVSGIEIYAGPATVPVEFRSTRGLEACGVIVVWSRMDAPEPRERRRRSQEKWARDSSVIVRAYSAEEVDSAARVDSTGVSQPFYPDSLYAFRISGEVVAQFIVDTTGQVIPETFTAVSSSHPAFTESVRRSLRHSKFRPAVLGGRRVRQVMVLPYRFVTEGRG